MSPPYATLIFDFDGTLADTRVALKTTLTRILEARRRPWPAGVAFDELSCLVIEDVFCAVGVCDPADVKRAVADFNALYAVAGPQLADPFPGVRQTLAELAKRGCRLAVATNEVRANLDRMLDAWQLSGAFSVTVCADEVAHTKPHPEMIERISRTLGVPPQTALMVGDSPLDIRMGKAAGCATCAAAYRPCGSERMRALHPDHVIHAFPELLGYCREVKRRARAGSPPGRPPRR